MRKFLKIYIWIYIVLALFGAMAIIGSESSPFEILRNTLFWVFGPICVFLYIYRKKWLPIIFWKIYFILKLIDIGYDFFYVKKFMQISSNISSSSLTPIHIFSYFISLIFVLPIFIAIYLYAFKEQLT